jgi:hypothetical protein
MTARKIVLSADPTNPIGPAVVLWLDKGTWTAKPVHGDIPEMSAWNAWNGEVSGCTAPDTCDKGWLNRYRILSWQANPERGELVIAGSAKRYKTPELAVNSAEITTFTLTHAAPVTFLIGGDYRDDKGGLTLEVKPA